MEIISAIGAVNTGLNVLSRLMPNRGNRPRSEFSQVLEQSMGRQIMQRLDIDSSGTLTLNETRIPESVFRQLDSDSNGELTEAEINTGLESMRRKEGVDDRVKAWIESRDYDHDGLISPAESGLDTAAFTSQDRDEDGRLARSELISMARTGRGRA